MEMVLTFVLMRALMIGLVVVGVAVLVAVVVVLARRAGRLDDIRRAAAPSVRWLGTRSGVLGTLGRGASSYLDRDGEKR